MKKEIQVLNGLVQNKEEYLLRLNKFYNAKTISLQDIIHYQESGLKFNADTLNLFAVELGKTEKEAAVKVYIIAAVFGSNAAKRNYALALIRDKNSSPEQLQEAIDLLKVVVDHDKKVHVNYYLGQAYYLLKQYPSALYYFKRVPQSRMGTENPEFGKAQKYLMTYNTLPATILKELFKLAGQGIVPTTVHRNLEVQPKKIKPWHNISRDFDGFDYEEQPLLLLNSHRTMVELKAAEAEVASIAKRLSLAELNKQPEVVLKTLRLQQIEANERVQAKNAKFNEVEKAFDELFKTPKRKEYLRQVQSVEHFFSPQRTHAASTKELACQLLQNRLTTDQAFVVPTGGANVPSRRRLTAELGMSQAWLDSYGTKKNHVGNNGVSKITYEEVYKHLLCMSGGTVEAPNIKNEEQIAKWMIRYTSKGVEVTIEELQEMCTDAYQKDLKKLMLIFKYCLIDEPKSCIVSAEESYDFPFVIAQARAVQLLAKGYIHLKDVFDHNAPYGIFTGGNMNQNIDGVLEKVDNINQAYNGCILTRKKNEHLLYFQFKREHPKGEMVTSREHLHKELVDMYGGGDDTDGEGYDSDTAERLHEIGFKFK